MRTASSTLQCLIGSARRASYCGQLDPSVQLAPNGHCGSLYLRSAVANSNESSLSIASYDEQRRRVTIYDGRVPCTPTAPTIPFELMTPFDAITQAVDDPVESFVQIVLETPDERPLMMPLISPSPTRMDLSPRQRHRSSSPSIKPMNPRPVSPVAHITLPKLNQHRSTLTTEVFDASQVHCQLPDVIEPMDFSFLEPVLRGESAAPPPPPIPPRNQSLHLVHEKFSPQRQFSHRSSSTTEDSAIELRTPSRSSYSSNRVATIEDDLTSPESLSGDTHNYYAPSPVRSNLSRATNWDVFVFLLLLLLS